MMWWRRPSTQVSMICASASGSKRSPDAMTRLAMLLALIEPWFSRPRRLAGLVVIFGVEAGVPAPKGVGDWMGLTAGVAWALAMVNLHRTAERPLFDRIFVQFVFLGPIFFLVALITGGIHNASPGAEALLDSAPWLLAFALVWMLPVIWLTIVGASRLDPGRVAILLMFEVIVGLTTAAVLTDEPFGAREAVGAGLILAASGTELTRRRRS